MTTYAQTLSPIARIKHKQLAQWLGYNVGFLGETETELTYLVNTIKFYVGVTYNKQTETFILYRMNDELEPLGLITITINAFMVMELFTKRRLLAALEVLK